MEIAGYADYCLLIMASNEITLEPGAVYHARTRSIISQNQGWITVWDSGYHGEFERVEDDLFCLDGGIYFVLLPR
jgi:hypothetical protein